MAPKGPFPIEDAFDYIFSVFRFDIDAALDASVFDLSMTCQIDAIAYFVTTTETKKLLADFLARSFDYAYHRSVMQQRTNLALCFEFRVFVKNIHITAFFEHAADGQIDRIGDFLEVAAAEGAIL